MEIIREEVINKAGDKMSISHSSDYAPEPDKKIFEVTYLEFYLEDSRDGQPTYWAVNTEYFETRVEAHKAFNIRRNSLHPMEVSGLPIYQFKNNSLYDILEPSLKS